MTAKFNHRDCKNFAQIDVTKGVCHRTKELISADGEQCGDFLLMPKCKSCKQFAASADTAEMGTCGASKQDPKFFAYPDMVALTCDKYQAC